MRYAVSIDEVSREEWIALTHEFLDHNYCQTWDYGMLRAHDTGAKSEHVIIRDEGVVVAMAECRVKAIPAVGGGLAYISGGPLCLRRGQRVAFRDLVCVLAAFRDVYARRRGCVLRVAPRPLAHRLNMISAAFTEAGYTGTAEDAPQRTILVDIGRDEDTLRRGLAQKWRNCLNAAERQGLTVRSGCEDGLFEAFHSLYAELVKRKGFDVPLGSAFYRLLQCALPSEEKLIVTLAFADATAVAGHVASVLGDTCVYILGASNEEGRRTRAAYLLQWHVVREAMRRGCKCYDLGGVDPEGNAGVYRFKRGLGGQEVALPGPFEAAPGWGRRLLVRGAERVYRAVRPCV